ncbi:hypothetical protein [Calidifontibacter indicus]|uniref:hypothetical protein n=1 Tax=Calidifontibacter indicus TaxID=419650 RepID=UPI003D72A620
MSTTRLSTAPPTTSGRARGRLALSLALGFVLLLLALVAGRVVWFRHEYGSWNPFDYPDRLTVHGRTYYPSTDGPVSVPPGPIVTAAQVGEITPGALVKVGSVGPIPFSSIGRHDVYANSSGCATAALLKVGSDRYGLYGLSGSY